MLSRLFVVALILFCCELGVLLLVLPWSALWERNYFLFRYPELGLWLRNHFLRGALSGLGLVDLALGFYYLTHFRETLARWQERSTDAASALHRPADDSLARDQTV